MDITSDLSSNLRLNTTAVLPATGAQSLQKSAASAKEDGKIDKSARDFEAILLGNWLQQAEETFAKVPGSDDDEDGATEQFGQISMQSLGTSFAANGGIGIAKMISTQLHRTEGAVTKTGDAEGAKT